MTRNRTCPEASRKPEPAAWLWPLGALATWGSAWAVFAWAVEAPLAWPAGPAAALAACVGVAASLAARAWWRKALLMAGFPVSALVAGVGLGPWVWALALVVLLLLYAPRNWRDAPLFPTPHGALDKLPAHAPLAQGALVLEAGCGLGHGLMALRRAYPLARLRALEYSHVLAWLAARRCPWAQVQCADMWAHDWSPYAMVYLFQRPETMARAAAKAQAEMSPGSWLVSLAFAVPEAEPSAHIQSTGGMSVWVYRLPLRGPRRPSASKTPG